MKFILCGLTFSLLFITISAIFPSDKITLTSFNKTYYLKDEVYTFDLVNSYQVPVQVLRHKIYTATTQAVQTQMKRALYQHQQNLEELSTEDHDVLLNYLGSVPHFVQVSKKKRSLPLNPESGFRVIPLTKKHFILHASYEDRVNAYKKRGLMQESVPLGSSICLHIPFFTTCDNSADLSAVKTALQAQVSAIRTELDSYKATNNARVNELTTTLNQQRGLITEIAQNTMQTNNMIAMIASSVAVNAAQIAHGDYIVHAQVNYLKRVTDSLLKYSNALASTDPRTVVAQPSMAKLFEGYKALLQVIKDENYIPIVDSRTFSFTEKALPQNTVNSIQPTNGTFVDPVTPGNDYLGFSVFLQGFCSQPSDLTCQSSTFTPTGWIFGPFHLKHHGIYPLLYQNGSTVTQMKATEVRPIVNSISLHSSAKPMYCIQFLGYTMLSDFQTTPNLINGIPTGSSAVPISNCDTYRLKESPGTNIFRLFSINEGVVVPFYSNCALDTLRAAYPTIPIGWMSQYPDAYSTSTGSAPQDSVPTGRDVFSRHWVSASCYINMDPAWIGMKYHIPDMTNVINDIPRGYDLNQFTINPEGELASSIEFLYTNRWAWVTTVVRTSDNNIITNEIDVLTGDTVLFDFPKGSPTLIDESDAFFGEGNNGRDCVQKKDIYDYDLLSCFYQNDQQGYTASQYQSGDVITTGIARFNNKFNFNLIDRSTDPNIPAWSFTLTPKSDADFTFYVQTDKFICPKLISQNNSVSGCTFTFVYTGSDSVQLNGKTNNALQFTNSTTSITVPLSNGNDYTLTVGVPPRECLIIPCSYGSTTSSISLVTPNVEIFPSSEVNLEAKVYFAIDATISNTVSEMNDVQKSVLTANENLTSIIDELAKLNFNVSELVPYEDFTELRARVDAMISTLLDSASGDKPCDSPWENADCFFQQFGTTLITIAVVLGVVIIGYVVLFKFGVAKKISDKCCKKGKSKSIPMSSQ